MWSLELFPPPAILPKCKCTVSLGGGGVSFLLPIGLALFLDLRSIVTKTRWPTMCRMQLKVLNNNKLIMNFYK